MESELGHAGRERNILGEKGCLRLLSSLSYRCAKVQARTERKPWTEKKSKENTSGTAPFED